MFRQFRSMMLERGLWSERTADIEPLKALVGRMRPMRSSFPLIRCGRPGEGSMLIPDDLEGIGACISPGMWVECSFDEDMAARGMEVVMADASVDGPPVAHERFRFTKTSVDSFASERTTTLDALCRDVTPGRDLLLDMDIEGAEYRVLGSMPDALLARFRIMAIEFHHLGALHTHFGLSEIAPVLDRLLRTHRIVHLHPNNAVPAMARGGIAVPQVMEITFLRKDRGTFAPSTGPYPHPLDAAVERGMPDLALPKCWYGG